MPDYHLKTLLTTSYLQSLVTDPEKSSTIDSKKHVVSFIRRVSRFHYQFRTLPNLIPVNDSTSYFLYIILFRCVTGAEPHNLYIANPSQRSHRPTIKILSIYNSSGLYARSFKHITSPLPFLTFKQLSAKPFNCASHRLLMRSKPMDTVMLR